MVLGGEADIKLNPSLSGQVEPGIGIELNGIPPSDQLGVFGAGNAPSPLFLLVKAVDGVESPVNEHPESILEPPVAAVVKTGR